MVAELLSDAFDKFTHDETTERFKDSLGFGVLVVRFGIFDSPSNKRDLMGCVFFSVAAMV
jgi:hypothetical protein